MLEWLVCRVGLRVVTGYVVNVCWRWLCRIIYACFLLGIECIVCLNYIYVSHTLQEPVSGFSLQVVFRRCPLLVSWCGRDLVRGGRAWTRRSANPGWVVTNIIHNIFTINHNIWFLLKFR